jgi:hypothetical protein
MNTTLTFYIKTMSSQSLWPLVYMWPDYSTLEEYEAHIRACDLYNALLKELSAYTEKEALDFWNTHVPNPHPFPSFLFYKKC